MRARVMIAILLLVLVLSSGVFMLFYMDNLCNRLLDLIDEAQASVVNAGADDGVSFLVAAAGWEADLTIVCSLVIHDQADLISQTFFQAKGFLESEAWDEYLSSLHQLAFLLSMVRDYDKPTVRSIL